MGEYSLNQLQDQIESSSRQLGDDLDRLSNEAGRIAELAMDPFGVRKRVLRSPLASCGAALIAGVIFSRVISRDNRKVGEYSLAERGVAKRSLVASAFDNLRKEAWSAISRGGQRAIWRAIFGGRLGG